MPMANKNAAANLTREARSKGGSMSRGNFKYDRQRASIAGQKGGRSSHKKTS
jgi:general stress protein YciG